MYDKDKIPRIILLVGIILICFFTASVLSGNEYLSDFDSYYYVRTINDEKDSYYLVITSLINTFINNIVISSNLWIFLIVGIIFWFGCDYIGNANSALLTLIMFFSDSFYTKSVNELDTHIPVALTLIIITYYFLKKEELDKWFIIPAIAVMLIIRVWNGYPLVVVYFLIVMFYLLLKEKARDIFSSFFPLILLTILISTHYYVKNYYELQQYGISELISNIIVFDNLIWLSIIAFLYFKNKNNKTAIITVFFLIISIIFLRFNYFLHIMLIMLFSFQSYNYFFKNERILVNYFLIDDRMKNIFLILCILPLITVYNFSTGINSVFMNDEYVDMAKYIDNKSLNVITHYHEGYFLNYYSKSYIHYIQDPDLKYTCDFDKFIEYADNRFQHTNYYYFLTSLDVNPDKYICDDGIKGALFNEKIRGFTVEKCGKNRDIKFCLFKRNESNG